MIRIENRCCDCATEGYPCLGRFCSLRRVEVHYCDICGEELGACDAATSEDGRETCDACSTDKEESA